MKRSMSLAQVILAASLMFTTRQLFAADSNDPKNEAASASVVENQRNLPPHSTAYRTAEQTPAPASAEAPGPCRWWQFRRCDDNSNQLEGLPPDAPRTGTVITVDVSSNMLYLYKDGQLVSKSSAATGTGKVLKQGRKLWAFHTPRGHLKVLRRIVDPVWTKPDWAFVEEGRSVPPPDSPKRLVKNHLGKYALDLGDGIMIHGTSDLDSIGRNASHGCVRLPSAMLEQVWKAAPIGTDVYIFESRPPAATTAENSQPERHSDLD
ncbi:MAG: L,D-transpeptidase [Acidobacteriota bacterium]